MPKGKLADWDAIDGSAGSESSVGARVLWQIGTDRDGIGVTRAS